MRLRRLVLILTMASLFLSGATSHGQENTSQDSATWSALTGVYQNDWKVAAATFNNPSGFDVAPVDGTLRAQIQLPEGGGVVVTNILPDSEAAKAGLAQHDILLKVNDTLINSPEMLRDLVSTENGKKVTLQVIRHGAPVTIEFTLPATATYEWTRFYNASSGQYRIGVTLAQADDTLRNQLRLAAGEGLVVTEVVADGPAAKAGIQQHDVLTKLDDKRLSTVENLEAQVQEIKDRSVTLEFLRGGREMSCSLAPQQNEWVEVTGSRDFAIWWGDNQALAVNEGVQRFTPMITWQLATAGAQPPDASATGNAIATQVAELKQQLAAMQKSLEALEASLQASATPEMPPKE